MASTIPTRCLAAADATGKMIRHTIARRAVGDADVHIKIRYSGICHSDIHTAHGDWGPQVYPQCVGHEILGDVVAVGSAVTKFKVGDVAGVGCFTDSCRKCEECGEGHEQYCSGGGMVGTYSSKQPEEQHPGGQTHGGESERARG
jgi:D-arabinose 1-dehydrogenase-like Zn-dependent alcohol dehydrogenase